MAISKRQVFVKKYGNEEAAKPLGRRERVALELLPEGHLLVEIGTGTGELLRLASTKFDYVIGLDLMVERLRLALLQGVPPRMAYVLADMDYSLPFRNATISCVVCVGTFEYAYDPFCFLDEIHRILAPDGSLVLQVANFVWLPRRVRLLAGRIPPSGANTLMQDRTWNGGYLHSYTLRDLLALLKECHFTVTELRSSGRPWRRGTLWPSLFASDFVMRIRKEQSTMS